MILRTAPVRMPRIHQTTREDLMLNAWKKVGCTKIAAKLSVEAFFDVIAGFLAKGDTVELRGHIRFKPVTRAPRPVRNPHKPGEQWTWPGGETVTVRFHPKIVGNK